MNKPSEQSNLTANQIKAIEWIDLMLTKPNMTGIKYKQAITIIDLHGWLKLNRIRILEGREIIRKNSYEKVKLLKDYLTLLECPNTQAV
jgi:hypothetical protein